MTEIDQHCVASITSAGWERDGDHALRHPTGWTIARYKTGDVRVYVLWSPANTTGAARTTGGMEKYGPFVTADAAKERHAELTRVNHG